MSKTWSAEHYLKFARERTRPAEELVSRIHIDTPETIVDLGCGPGNSTQVLLNGWPDARIIGVDSSVEMIQAARERFPNQEWIDADICEWSNQQKFDVVFSNAVLHWISDHPDLVTHLFSLVADGGALAFQIPCGINAPVRSHITDVSRDPKWNDRMDSPRSAFTVEDASVYYEVLSPGARNVDIWQTTYHHVLDDVDAIVDWISSTSLRPFLAALETQTELTRFIEMLRERIDAAYPSRSDGKVIFPFERLFVVACR